jgi:AcrR family transcriptional regulator
MAARGKPSETNIGRRRASAKVDAGPAYDARREEIIRAAGRVFLAKGFEATTFRDIAESIGMDRATLYYYFASKRELFQTATGAAVVRNTEAAERVAASDTPAADKVRQIFTVLLESYTATDYPYVYILLQEDIRRISDDKWARTMHAVSDRFEAAVAKVFADGMQAGVFSSEVPPVILTKAALGMVNWTYRWYRRDGDLSAAQVAGLFSHIFLRGLTS